MLKKIIQIFILTLIFSPFWLTNSNVFANSQPLAIVLSQENVETKDFIKNGEKHKQVISIRLKATITNISSHDAGVVRLSCSKDLQWSSDENFNVQGQSHLPPNHGCFKNSDEIFIIKPGEKIVDFVTIEPKREMLVGEIVRFKAGLFDEVDSYFNRVPRCWSEEITIDTTKQKHWFF